MCVREISSYLAEVQNASIHRIVYFEFHFATYEIEALPSPTINLHILHKQGSYKRIHTTYTWGLANKCR